MLRRLTILTGPETLIGPFSVISRAAPDPTGAADAEEFDPFVVFTRPPYRGIAVHSQQQLNRTRARKIEGCTNSYEPGEGGEG